MTRVGLLAVAALLGIAAEPARIDVYLVGDSTMADKPTPETNPERGWGQLLPKFFDAQVVVHNHAVNGRSTKSFIDEGRWAAVLSQLKRGDFVFIEFGHNDEKIEDTLRYAAPHGAYKANLERFIAETRGHGATPVLFTPIVRRKFSPSGALEETHGEYPAVAAEVARETQVAFVDLGASTRQLVSAAGPEGSKRLYVWVKPGESPMYPEGRQDDTHLSLVGATEVARLAAAAVRKLDLAVSRHVVGIDSDPVGTSPSMPLYDGAVPGSVGDAPDDRPSITPFIPSMRPRSAAVLFPGGGYDHVTVEKEGAAVARWLNGLGVAAFVVRYRVGPRYRYPAPVDDGLAALRVVRANAARWGIDPATIGVMGFSAGGHLAALVAARSPVEARPAFMVLGYPVITMRGASAHQGSRQFLLGNAPSDALIRETSAERTVSRRSPPTFIVATLDDASVPVANARMMYDTLRAAGVDADLELFEHGRHGFGLASDDPALHEWTDRCARWLARHGWATSAPRP